MSITAECLIVHVEAPRRSWQGLWGRVRRTSWPTPRRSWAAPSPSRALPTAVRLRGVAAAGALAALVLVVLASGVLPLVRHWRVREARLAARTEQLARVRGLLGAERALAESVRMREARLDARAQRPLAAGSAARAGAALGVLVQQAAGESQVQVERVELAAGGAADPALVTASVSAVGDVYGLTELLQRLQRGPALVEVTALDVRTLPTLGRESLLQLTLTVRAVWGPR